MVRQGVVQQFTLLEVLDTNIKRVATPSGRSESSRMAQSIIEPLPGPLHAPPSPHPQAQIMARRREEFEELRKQRQRRAAERRAKRKAEIVAQRKQR
jgi:hypothetical protein